MTNTAANLPVENSTIVRLNTELKARTGLTIMTDEQGKADGEADRAQHGGTMVESRYFLEDILITRAIGTNPNNGMPRFDWSCEGQTFRDAVSAIRHALSIRAAR